MIDICVPEIEFIGAGWHKYASLSWDKLGYGNGCRLFRAKLVLIANWTRRNRLQWNFNRNSYIFTERNEFEYVVCKIAKILTQPQWVKEIHERPYD